MECAEHVRGGSRSAAQFFRWLRFGRQHGTLSHPSLTEKTPPLLIPWLQVFLGWVPQVDARYMNTRLMIWGGVAVTVLACIGLGVYFGFAGLSKATDLAGIIGMFIAVAGLGVSVWGVIVARGGQSADGQFMTGSRVTGQVNQIGTIRGSARIGGTASQADAPASRRETAAAPGPAEGSAAGQAGPAGQVRQSITDSEVSGTVNQLGVVDDDLDISGSP